jgi:hypothetical protein
MKSTGYFKDENIAKAFAVNQPDFPYNKTAKRFILTNGVIGFVIGEKIIILDDKKTKLETKEKILAKLSLEERAILGI